MAFTEQEKSIAKQIKEQGGSKQDFLDVLQQVRSRQAETTPKEIGRAHVWTPVTQ